MPRTKSQIIEHEKVERFAQSHPTERRFFVRRSDGSTSVADMSTIKRWVLEERLTRGDVVEWGDRPSQAIELVEDLRPYFTLLDASRPRARRLRADTSVARVATPAPEEDTFDAGWSRDEPLVEVEAVGSERRDPTLPIETAFATEEPQVGLSEEPLRHKHTPIPPMRRGRRRGPAAVVSLVALLLFALVAGTFVARASAGRLAEGRRASRMDGDPTLVARARGAAIPRFHRAAPEVARGPGEARPATDASLPQEIVDTSGDAGHGYYYLLTKAERLREEGDCGRAKPTYDRALVARPLAPAALVGLGLCLLGEGDVAGAKVRFEDALRVRPSFAPAAHALVQTQSGDAS